MKTTPHEQHKQTDEGLTVLELIEACQVLGVTPDDLLRDLYPGELGYPEKPDAESGNPEQFVELIRFISKYAKLSESDKRNVRRMFADAIAQAAGDEAALEIGPAHGENITETPKTIVDP